MPIESLLLVALAVYGSLFVYSIGFKNLRDPTHRTLMLTFAFIVLWALGDALMLGARSNPWIGVGIFLFSVAPIYTALNVLMFTFKLANLTMPKVFRWGAITVAIGLTAHIIINDPLFDRFIVARESINSFVVNPLHYSIYSAYFSSFFMATYVMILLHAFRQTGKERSQALRIFWAALISSGCALLTNLLLPTLGTSQLVWLGPIFTPVFILVAVHTVAKGRLFEIRRIVVRSTYAAGVVTVAAITQIALAFAIRRFSGDSIADNTAVVAIIFFIFGLLFVYLWDLFRVKTTKYLYKDAYDSEEVLKSLSNAMVKEYKLDSLEDESLHIMADALKPKTIHLILVDSNGEYYKHSLIGDDTERLDTVGLLSMLADQSDRVLFVDSHKSQSTPIEDPQYDVIGALNATQLGASIRLQIKQDTIGFLLLGRKLDDNPYTSQDQELTAIASNELAVAIQNARRYEEISRFNQTLNQEVQKATSELRVATSVVEAQKRQIESIVSSIDEAIFGLNPQGLVVYANSSAMAMVDNDQQPVGKNISDLLQLEDKSGRAVNLSSLIKQDSANYSERRLIIRYSADDFIVVAVIVRAVQLSQGQHTGSVIVLRDITEQTSNQEERHAYVSLLFHELRTPLTYLEGQLSNIKLITENTDNQHLVESVHQAHTEVLSLESIVNHLGQYVQAESSQDRLPRHKINLATIVDEIRKKYQTQANDKQIDLQATINKSSRGIVIKSNEVYVRSILTALVDNAIKFTEKGKVSVHISHSPGYLRVDVSDTGIGINRHHQQTIFESSKQAEDFKTRTKGGLGLSLYTASRYARHLNAQLSVTSKVGEGSTFSLMMPIE